jgi:ammonia channel protein AmtB
MGSQVQIIGRTGCTTSLASATGGFFSFVFHGLRHRGQPDQYSLVALCDGILSGLVAITSGCFNVKLEGAFVIGIVTAFA